MKRLNLRDVPDDVYEVLSAAAESEHRSLNSFVVERLVELAELVRLPGYLESYVPPRAGLTTQDAVDAVRAVRDAS